VCGCLPAAFDGRLALACHWGERADLKERRRGVARCVHYFMLSAPCGIYCSRQIKHEKLPGHAQALHWWTEMCAEDGDIEQLLSFSTATKLASATHLCKSLLNYRATHHSVYSWGSPLFKQMVAVVTSSAEPSTTTTNHWPVKRKTLLGLSYRTTPLCVFVWSVCDFR
jgi:hypothetical protein